LENQKRRKNVHNDYRSVKENLMSVQANIRTATNDLWDQAWSVKVKNELSVPEQCRLSQAGDALERAETLVINALAEITKAEMLLPTKEQGC
jgi:hypothetical protein